MSPLLAFIVKYAYLGIFVALGLGIVGLPVPNETVQAFAGYLCYKGELSLAPAILAGFLGTSFGITVGFAAGRLYGRSLLERHLRRLHISPERLSRARQWYARYGGTMLFFGYFVPGVRHLVAIVSGLSLTPFRTFALIAYTGGMLWTLLFTGLGYYLGENWQGMEHYLYGHIIPIALALLLVSPLIAMWLTRARTRR